ncbi:uncharacterized membrane protein YhaH (DUF805 family) [Pseudonocardia sediminis]|uniref:Uncharacterized membrane protein YhaH (DUF805 family) n=1 Tax=Pseudonocardia sediminis TaxID=1397368 RepID=A0A4Q7V475_PSEST|nr:DUF805 domain-containing protein [Pseudonocardia sediminis]RZT89216.1 uncharacterized membrane protein YhaH (DUF805 family) [Pseudonocardia sediminis]
MQWYLKVLRQYADFSGRARRKEFWMFVLFNVIVAIVLSILDNALGLSTSTATESGFYYSAGILTSIYQLAVLIPSLAVGARRLHDTGRSGWWQLIAFIPLVGAIILIVFWASDGHRGPNQHGPNPKELAAPGAQPYNMA